MKPGGALTDFVLFLFYRSVFNDVTVFYCVSNTNMDTIWRLPFLTVNVFLDLAKLILVFI